MRLMKWGAHTQRNMAFIPFWRLADSCIYMSLAMYPFVPRASCFLNTQWSNCQKNLGLLQVIAKCGWLSLYLAWWRCCWRRWAEYLIFGMTFHSIEKRSAQKVLRGDELVSPQMNPHLPFPLASNNESKWSHYACSIGLDKVWKT